MITRSIEKMKSLLFRSLPLPLFASVSYTERTRSSISYNFPLRGRNRIVGALRERALASGQRQSAATVRGRK